MILIAKTGAIGLSTLDYLMLFAYLCVMIALGMGISRGGKDTESYLLGGRRMPWWAVAASFFVAVTSTLSLVGIPGEAYQHGAGYGLFALFSPIFAIITFLVFIRFFFQAQVFTPFSYLAGRFDTRIRGVSAGIVSLARLLYIGLVLYSSAKVFEGSAGWPVWQTIILVGVIAIVYTVLGGMQTVVWVDVFQFVVMFGGLGILLVKLLGAVPDGATGVVAYAMKHDHFITQTGENFWSFSPYVRLTFWLIMMQTLVVWMFFNSSDQIAIQRLLSTSGYKQARRSMFAIVAIDLTMILGMLFIGLALWAYYQQQTSVAVPEDGDLALFSFVTQKLPAPLPGLIVAAMLAAIFSTVDAAINALATIFTKDFYLPFFRPQATEADQVLFARWITMLTGVFGIATALAIACIAESADNRLLESSYIWLSAQSIVPGVFVLAVFSRRARAGHALIALASGITVVTGTTAWYFFEKFSGKATISPFYIGAAGLLTTIVVGFTASCFARRPEQRRVSDRGRAIAEDTASI